MRAPERAARREAGDLSTDPACPDCGGALAIDPCATIVEEYAVSQHNRAHPILTRTKRVPVASCTRCGWTIAIRERAEWCWP